MTTTMSAIATPVALMLFVFTMVYAALSDITIYRIRNNLVLTLLVGYAVLAPVVGFTHQEMLRSLAAAGVVLLFTFALFAVGWIGGGDAKLASVTTLWLGADKAPSYLLFLMLLGGVLAVLVYLFRALPLSQRVANTAWVAQLRASDKGNKLPYGVAITMAGLCVLPSSRWMM